jgi:hypothetical protein
MRRNPRWWILTLRVRLILAGMPGTAALKLQFLLAKTDLQG